MINEQPADFLIFVLVHLSFGFQPNLITKTQRKTQRHGLKTVPLSFWRRKRDLNPRAGCPTYSLSRGASSPLEYFSKC